MKKTPTIIIFLSLLLVAVAVVYYSKPWWSGQAKKPVLVNTPMKKLLKDSILQVEQSYEEAAEYYGRQGQVLQQADALLQVAGFAIKKQDYLKAQRVVHNVISLYEQLQYGAQQEAYDLLNEIHSQMGNYKLGLQYGQAALMMARQVNDTSVLVGTVYLHIGLARLNLAMADSAVQAFRRALAIAQKYDHPDHTFQASKWLAIAYNMMGQYDDALKVIGHFLDRGQLLPPLYKNEMQVCMLAAYSGKKDWPQAERSYKTLYALLDQDGAAELAKTGYLEMIRYQLRAKHFEQATTLMDRAREVFVENNMHDQLKALYALKFAADTAAHQLKKAFASHALYRKVADSVALISRETNVANMEKQFDAEMALRNELNEDNMAFLRTKDKLQDVQLKQTRTRSYILLGSAILLALLLVVGIFVFRLKQKNTELLEAQKTAIAEQNHSLKILVDQQVQLIQEKEWLVKQVHHRVKNNLQVIVGLLNYQSRFLTDQSAVTAIRSTQHRVRAMSFIHQRLYKDGSMQSVNIAVYVRELVAYLRSALDTGTQARFYSRVPDMDLDVAQAVPIGLILNEAVTNAMKYAFPGQADGLITITFEPGEGGLHLLSIKDNGVGLPPGFDPEKSKTLGFTLIQTMAEQIGASFAIRSEGGLELLFSFTIRPLSMDDEPNTTEASYV